MASTISQGQTVPYGTQSGQTLQGYLAVPSGSGAHPAVVLIHEWWGLNDNIREYARKFADAGYVALAVDLYDGQSTTDQAQAQQLAGSVQGNLPKAFDNLKQAVAYVKARNDVKPGSLAAVGWCFGGGWSYQMAKNDLGTRASVMYYGQVDPHDDFAHMKSSILGHYGDQDAVIKLDTVKEFQAALKTAQGQHEVYIYPNRGHGFANANDPTYDEADANLAWKHTIEFLQKAL